MSRIVIVTIICLTFAGCGTNRSSGRSHLRATSETDQPIVISGGNRSVRVERKGADTRIALGDGVITIRGHGRYIADVGLERGWVRAGNVTVVYDGEVGRITTRKNWSTFRVSDSLSLVVRQDGTVARSVFKE